MTTAWTAQFGTDIRPAAIQWIWHGFLARGKLALLDGDPEMGKSLVSVDLVARLGRGGPMPDGTALSRPGTSLILSAEDDAADTIRPRLEAAGADLSRVIFPNFNGRAARFPDDIPALEELIWEHAVELVVIDPLTAFFSTSVAWNADPGVRSVLSPFKTLATRTGTAFLMLRHLTKRSTSRAIQRGLGSIGIVAACRTAMLAAPHPDDPDLRVLAPLKGNITTRPKAQTYRIAGSPEGQPLIEWTGPQDISADEALDPDHGESVRPRDRASDWLKRELAAGPRRAAELYAAAADAGIPERTLRRAKDEIRVQSHRTWDHAENRGEWYWFDPDSDWPKDAPFRRPRELPPLDVL